MCGIAGIYAYNSITDNEIEIIKKINFIQRHRGPDDEGIFFDKSCVLGHRRLSIIDLSPGGHQPFFSNDGRYCLIYNGEIYNYIELREELKAYNWKFRTESDTEVLLKSYEHYGIDCLQKFNGMFSFVLYDTKENKLLLVRDRFGIKPLYYLLEDNRLYFASEIKAFKSIEHHFSVNNHAIFDYLVFNRTDIHDETFFNEIKRIPKGHYGIFYKDELQIKQWWNPENYLVGESNTARSEIYQKIDDIFTSSVKLRIRSDVPVGSCLSGGLDSSIITGILYEKKLVKDNFYTFTASFPGFQLDETQYIDVLNRKYPFENLRTYPTSAQAYNDIEHFVYYNDEPTTDAAFYSQYEVMKLAKNNEITVLLDGQGGDENFAGYQYFHGFYLTGLLKKKKYSTLFNEFLNIIKRKQDFSAIQTFIFQIVSEKTKKRLLQNHMSHIDDDFFLKSIDKSVIFNNFFCAHDLNTSIIRHFQYKLEHLLRTEDRNSMAFSIEARVPYLDYRLVEYLLSLDDSLKIKSGETKHLQKKALSKYTIQEITDRKDKIGFATPFDDWINNESWKTLFQESMHYLEANFPFILKKKYPPINNKEKWKMIQLCLWKQQFID